MKPEDYKLPFTWESPRVVIKDRVWFTPEVTQEPQTSVSLPHWESAEFFGNSHPIYLEYCSGNGAWIAAKAEAFSNQNWIAIEKKFARVRKIWSKMKNQKLTNLFAICGEAYHVTKSYILNESVSEIFINFPDPWPKRRHAKYRLIQPPFAYELGRILKRKGKLTLVTDDPAYSAQMISIFRQQPGFVPCFDSPYYVTDLTAYGTSYFEDLWRGKGKLIRYHRFEKK